MYGKVDWYTTRIDINPRLMHYLSSNFSFQDKRTLEKTAKVFTSILWGMQAQFTANPNLPEIRLNIFDQAKSFTLAQLRIYGNLDTKTISHGEMVLNPEAIGLIEDELRKNVFAKKSGRDGISFNTIFEVAAILGAHESQHADSSQLDFPYYSYQQIMLPLATQLNLDPLIVMNSQPRELDSIRAEANVAAQIRPAYRAEYDRLIDLLENTWQQVSPHLTEK